MKSIVVTGVPGVGKTTVGSTLAKRLRCEFLEYSGFMLQAVGEADRAEIHRLSFAERLPIYRAVEVPLGEYFSDKREGYAVLTTHISIRLDGVIHKLPLEHFEAYNAAQLVIVEADPAAIIERRHKDSLRIRSVETEQEIDLHQQRNRALAVEIAKHLSIKTTFVDTTLAGIDINTLADRVLPES
ncbi:MAG: AAA family ATPase [Pseudomonadota bacterium]